MVVAQWVRRSSSNHRVVQGEQVRAYVRMFKKTSPWL